MNAEKAVAARGEKLTSYCEARECVRPSFEGALAGQQVRCPLIPSHRDKPFLDAN